MTKPNLSPEFYCIFYTESVAVLIDHFADVFVLENVARVYDADSILFREIQCKKRYILMFN